MKKPDFEIVTNKSIYTIFVCLFVIFLFAPTIFSQNTLPAPKQEKLLNGLKVLMWPDAKSDKVAIKIRIHSGSAFDPQGKEGLMQMLADNLFPNEAARDFFTEDLGGGLEIITNYDYVQINASSKPEGFLTMLETLATAVSNPAIDKETTAKLRTALLAKVAIKEANPDYVADQAVAKRLFGTFPYGRPQLGTADSLKKIDFGDLIDAKNRFLTADNATMTISGNFDKATGFRAIRRYFGSWLKADKKVPATFRQPDEPDTKPFEINLPSASVPLVRFAIQGVSRSDKDFYATNVLADIIFSRLARAEPKNAIKALSVTNQAGILPGIFVIGYSFSPQEIDLMKKRIGVEFTSQKMFSDLADHIGDDEFARSKAKVVTSVLSKEVSDYWLDVDTYKLTSVNDEFPSYQNLTISDVKRVATRLMKNRVVTVVVALPETVMKQS